MNPLFPICAVLFLSPGAFVNHLETPAFSLSLKGQWEQMPSNDPEQQCVRSKALGIDLTTSFMRFDPKGKSIETVARKFVEIRLQAENRSASEHNINLTIAEPIVVPFSKGVQIAYYGHDNKQRQFRFLGIVTQSHIISINAESSTQTQQGLEQSFNGILSWLSLK